MKELWQKIFISKDLSVNGKLYPLKTSENLFLTFSGSVKMEQLAKKRINSDCICFEMYLDFEYYLFH